MIAGRWRCCTLQTLRYNRPMMRLLAGLLVVATVATACTAGGVADQPSAPTPTESAQGIPTAASQRGQDSALPARTPAISAAREAPVPTPAPTTAAAGTTPNATPVASPPPATPGASLPPTPAATAGLEPDAGCVAGPRRRVRRCRRRPQQPPAWSLSRRRRPHSCLEPHPRPHRRPHSCLDPHRRPCPCLDPHRRPRPCLDPRRRPRRRRDRLRG